MNTRVCERCDREMRLVPAGTSKKTGKPYSAFWSCDQRSGGCGNTARADEVDAESGGGPVTTFSAPRAGANDARLAAIEEKLDQLIELVRGMQQ